MRKFEEIQKDMFELAQEFNALAENSENVDQYGLVLIMTGLDHENKNINGNDVVIASQNHLINVTADTTAFKSVSEVIALNGISNFFKDVLNNE